MLKNCVNKLPCKTQTVIQDSAAENCSRKYTCLTMWALCNALTRRHLPSNTHNNWLYAAAATNKTSQENPFTHHQRSVKVCDDISWQDKIGLHQFDNYVIQVKINVTTVNNSCFLSYSRYLASSSSFSRTVPRHTERVRQSAFLSVT